VADSWERSRKKKKGYGFIVTTVLVLLFAGVLLVNNSDIFLSKKNRETAKTEIDTGVKKHETETKEAPSAPLKDTVEKSAPVEPPPETPEPAKKIPLNPPPDAEEMLSVDVPSVQCVLAESKPMSIDVSLKLHFKGKKLQQEILFKRDTIKILVKRVFSRKYLAQIVTDSLRAELKKEINGMLKQGQVSDVEFINFTPVE